MSLRLAARFARRELRSGFGQFRILLACLALGVAAIAAIGTLRSSIEAGLTQEGAALLGGDAQLDFTYRFADEQERNWLAQNAQKVSEITDFRSMVVIDRQGQTERALTQVKSVDSAYPLTGEVILTPPMPLTAAFAGDGDHPGAVMAPQLIERLALSVGDTFRLGTQQFVLMATLTTEPDSAADGFGLGPRTMVLTQDLQSSGLMAPGTLFSTKYRFLVPPGTDLEQLKTQAQEAFATKGMRWSDLRNGAPGISEFVARLGAFLVLIGLSGLAVGGIGVSAAVRTYLSGKTNTIATLRSIGADRTTIFLTYFLQIGLLALIGTALGLMLGAGLPLVLAPLIATQLPVPALFAIYPAPLIEAALYGLLTAAIFTLWPLARTEEIRAAALFRDALTRAPLLPARRYVVATLLLLWLLLALASWFNGSLRLTLWTAGGILIALLMLALAALLIRILARQITPLAQGRPILRWALSAIGGTKEGAGAVVMSLGLGLSVLAVVGQIDGNLRRAISGNLPEVAPSYFLVDIQKDQIDPLRARLKQDPQVRRLEDAPMLRGLITRINDRPAQEVAPDHWVLQGDRGITYAAQQGENTTLTAGEWWPEDYTGAPQISFSAEEGAEMGLKLGDTLTLNVLGRDITATITSFREVDFSTAGIGFILSMNPSALAGAPHSFIATLYAEPQAETPLLREISDQYPNITAIRVRDAIERASGLLAGIASATSYGAAITLITGFLVLIGTAAASQQARTFEAATLKTLGATRAQLRRSFALRSALLGTAAGLVALAAGTLGGWAVCHFVLSTNYQIIWPNALMIITGGILATLQANLLYARRPLSARPAQILRSQD